MTHDEVKRLRHESIVAWSRFWLASQELMRLQKDYSDKFNAAVKAEQEYNAQYEYTTDEDTTENGMGDCDDD